MVKFKVINTLWTFDLRLINKYPDDNLFYMYACEQMKNCEITILIIASCIKCSINACLYYIPIYFLKSIIPYISWVRVLHIKNNISDTQKKDKIVSQNEILVS